MSAKPAYDSFQGDFSANGYVSKICSLSISSAEENRPANAEFDCVPFIDLFETKLAELKKFYLTIESRVESLSYSLENDGGEVFQKTATLGNGFTDIFGSFEQLNLVAEKISGSTLRIGKQLESIQNEKNRAEEAREILGYFLDLNSDSRCAKIDNLTLSPSIESKKKLAYYLRKLNYIAKCEIPGAENASKIITAKYASFETEIMNAFMNAFSEDDIPAMKDSSEILVALNDASTCMKIFIDKHAFFQEPYNCSEVFRSFFTGPNNERIPIDFSSPAAPDKGLISTFDLILKTVTADWRYLEEVFESPRSVMNALLQRVFDEIIMRHVDEGLKQAGMHSTVQYLRYLASSYSGTLDFIDKLLVMYRDHMDDLPVTSIDGVVEETRTFLLSLHSEIFERYVKPSDVQMLEARFIQEVLDICSIPIRNFVNHKKISKAAKNIFNLGNTADLKIVPQSEIEKRAFFYRFAGNFRLVENEDLGFGITSPNALVRLLRLVSEAVSRMKVFYNEKLELGDMVENYMVFFIESFRKLCIAPTFAFIIENQDSGCDSSPFDAQNLALIQGLNSILGIAQIFFEEQIIPLSALVSPVCCRRMYELKNSFFETCLRYINKVLRLEINAITSNLSNIAQKCIRRSDYKPRPDNMSAFNTSTQFCLATKDYLRLCSKKIVTFLPQPNSSRVINQIFKIFFEQLLEIIKKLSFNDIGALVLLNDVNSFAEMLPEQGPQSFKELSPFVAFLRELANVLMVKPENLRAVLQEGSLNLIDVRLIYPFIQLRSDFRTSNVEALFPEIELSGGPGGFGNGLF